MRKLVLFHRAEVEISSHQPDEEQQRQNGVQVHRDGLHEQREAVHRARLRQGGADRRRPRGDRGDDADRSRRCVDDVGELCARDAVFVGDRTHDRANGQTVEIVVDKDEDAEKGRCEGGAAARLDSLDRPFAVGARRARFCDERHQNAEQHQKDADVDVVAELAAHDLEGRFDRVERVEAGVQQSACQNADEQRGVDLLGDERQRNGDNRRQQRPDCCCDVHILFSPLFLQDRIWEPAIIYYFIWNLCA